MELTQTFDKGRQTIVLLCQFSLCDFINRSFFGCFEVEICQEKKKKSITTTTFQLKCSCGNKRFLLSKSVNDDKDDKFDQYWKSLKVPIFSTITARDKNGEMYFYGTTFFGIKVGKFYVKDMRKTYFSHVVKAKCEHCGKEIVLFDSKCYGYDALAEEEDAKERAKQINEATGKAEEPLINYEYPKEFVNATEPSEVYIEVWQTLPFEVFAEDFGEDIERYSIAYDGIEVSTLINGKKKTFFEEETS